MVMVPGAGEHNLVPIRIHPRRIPGKHVSELSVDALTFFENNPRSSDRGEEKKSRQVLYAEE